MLVVVWYVAMTLAQLAWYKSMRAAWVGMWRRKQELDFLRFSSRDVASVLGDGFGGPGRPASRRFRCDRSMSGKIAWGRSSQVLVYND